MATVDVYMLDWNGNRPCGHPAERCIHESLAAFEAGRYEYTFTLNGVSIHRDEIEACEAAYLAQGNGPRGYKLRHDRQTMAIGDMVAVDGRVYVCAAFGFQRIAQLDKLVAERIEASWEAWSKESDVATNTR